MPIFNSNLITKIIEENKLFDSNSIHSFLDRENSNYNFYELSKIIELANQKRLSNSAYYTDYEILEIIKKKLPDLKNDSISILEPSVGAGNFIPLLIEKYKSKKIVNLDLVDIDEDSISILKHLLMYLKIPKNFKIKFFTNDFLNLPIKIKYDLAIGNPPFSKTTRKNLSYLKKDEFNNFSSTNLSSYFLEKCIYNSRNICMVMPKNILNTPEFLITRNFLKSHHISSITDFGEYGFKGVLIETILICTLESTSKKILVESIPKKLILNQDLKYITDDKYPYWIIYRNKFFDDFSNKINFGIFSVFRDRQITNSLMRKNKGIRVIKSRNISEDGKIVNIKGYDSYIDKNISKKFSVYKYIDSEKVYLTPNMTYKTRMIKKPKGVLVNGSVAILIPKNNNIKINDDDIKFFSTKEYRAFYEIARNFQTRTLNVDSSSVYFFGIRR